jgi:hypothetical protein
MLDFGVWSREPGKMRNNKEEEEEWLASISSESWSVVKTANHSFYWISHNFNASKNPELACWTPFIHVPAGQVQEIPPPRENPQQPRLQQSEVEDV